MRLVVDASVAIKWYLPEIHSEEAERLLNSSMDLCAPDLIFSEIGNILWKRVLRKDLTEEKARSIMSSLGALPLTIWRADILAEGALSIACSTKRSFYDSLYLSLAVTSDCRLVTADLKLLNSLKNVSLFKKHLLWVEDVPEKSRPLS
jgi:predicted nucleic acid-binding protein